MRHRCWLGRGRAAQHGARAQREGVPHPRWTPRMCFWIPAAVLSTFPQFFQRHLNITFMEFWRGESTESEVKTDLPMLPAQHASSFLFTRSSSRPHEWTDGRTRGGSLPLFHTRKPCCANRPPPAAPEVDLVFSGPARGLRLSVAPGDRRLWTPQSLPTWPSWAGYLPPPKTDTSVGVSRVLVTLWVLEAPLFTCPFRLRGGEGLAL